MSEPIVPPASEPEQEIFPVEPRYHPIHKVPRKIYDFLASSRLAMLLLVVILGCCVTGVTLYRGARAGEMIFGTIWFNALLVLLVVNVACCFFGRVWRRRVTVVSFGMILFHLSFVAIMFGIIYNSLFYFRGTIRLTEGEVLPSGDPASYDTIQHGRFFSFSRLKGETSLVRMHAGYTVSGEDKRAAYEVEVGEGKGKKRDLLYITHKLTHDGVDYFNEKEGYSVLLILSDREGKELFGAHQPLQSIPSGEDRYIYSTGYKHGDNAMPGTILFPAGSEPPRFAVQARYLPSKQQERQGEMQFVVFPLGRKGEPLAQPLAEGKAPIGQPFAAGDYLLTPREIRYWVGMTVRYEPGKPIVLISLWAGLAGMIITTAGRILRPGRKRLPCGERLASEKVQGQDLVPATVDTLDRL
ncbi:MAG TPA: hypothetical protein VI298_09460 [Geobacteraceae bacterium]